MLESLPTGITFSGQVADFLPSGFLAAASIWPLRRRGPAFCYLVPGVFVHVFRHQDEKPLLGFLPRFLFAQGAFGLAAAVNCYDS